MPSMATIWASRRRTLPRSGRSAASSRTCFATASQNKAEAAQKAGRFKDEIAPYVISTKKGDVTVEADEYIRHGATMEAAQKLRPAFKKDGTVTAGNASGLNDGAAALVVMSAKNAEKRGLTPLARIASWATAGVAPEVMVQARSRPRGRRWKRRAGRRASLILLRPTRPSRRRRSQ